MPQILFVHSSANANEMHPVNQGAYTRKMARLFRDRIKGRGIRVVDRDIAARPPVMVDRFFVSAANTAEHERTPEQHDRLRESDELVSEVLKSDVIVISCPIYQFGLPTPLKAWAENLVRPGMTYTQVDRCNSGVLTYGLLHNKMVVMLESTADQITEAPKVADETRPADSGLTRIFSNLGVRNIQRVLAHGISDNSPDHLARSWALCENKLETVVERVRTRWRAQRNNA